MLKGEGEPKDALERKKLSSVWAERFDFELDELEKKDNLTMQELIDVLWNKGILDRICPENQDEKQARIDLQKGVFEGERTDPKLYWRIIYSAAACIEGSKRNLSIISGSQGFVTPIFNYRRFIYGENSEKFVKEIFPDKEQRKNPDLLILNEIINKAKKELERLGEKPPQKIIPYETKGVWQGIPVIVDCYTDSGMVWLKPDEERSKNPFQDHDLIGRKSGYKGISPDELNLKDFEL